MIVDGDVINAGSQQEQSGGQDQPRDHHGPPVARHYSSHEGKQQRRFLRALSAGVPDGTSPHGIMSERSCVLVSGLAPPVSLGQFEKDSHIAIYITLSPIEIEDPYWNIVMFPAHFGIYSLGDYSVHAREGADVHDAVRPFLMQVDGASSREDHLSHGSVAGEIGVCQLQQLGHVRLLSPRE